MADLWAAALAFVLTHLIPAIGPLRAQLVRALGKPFYIAFYSAVSLGVLVWLGFAYANAPYVALWGAPVWGRWVAVLVLPFSCFLLVGALTSPNPLSTSPSAKPYDPDHPGIVSVTRHPLMAGLALWAAVHIPPNGDLASLILFGLLLVLSLLGMANADAKARARLGEAVWAARVRTGPVDWRGIGAGRAIAALALYAGLIAGHPYVLGVSPLP